MSGPKEISQLSDSFRARSLTLLKLNIGMQAEEGGGGTKNRLSAAAVVGTVKIKSDEILSDNHRKPKSGTGWQR